MTYVPRYLSGRLSNGAERGKGTLYHAIPLDARGNASEWATAVCGARPGRRSGSGFVEPLNADQAITCPRCLKKLVK